MKTLIIPHPEWGAMLSRYQWLERGTIIEHYKQQLIDAGFDMAEIIYRDKDEEGHRRFRQLEQGEQEADLG